MNSILEQAQQLLHKDYGSPDATWSVIDRLLEEATDQRQTLMEWIFTQHQGYVDVRVRAGREVLSDNPEQGWHILEQLLGSQDPDDRDTALTLLSESHDRRAEMLVKPMLNDPWPYLVLNAAEFLKNIYPSEVVATLHKLLQHEQEWVRHQAYSLLDELEIDAGDN
jgi:HEAT repeat protein